MESDNDVESDYSSGSSDNYIPGTESSSSNDEEIGGVARKKKRFIFERARNKSLITNIRHGNEPAAVSTTLNEDLPNSKEISVEGNELEQQTEVDNEATNRLENDTTPKKNVRKRIPRPETWKQNISKKAHSSGRQYVSRRGKKVPGKTIKTKKNCASNCRFKCATKVSEDERNDIFATFYSLPSATEKRHFFLNTTERSLTLKPKRTPKQAIEENSSNDDENPKERLQTECSSPKRKYTFSYYVLLKSEKIRVCKTFYLTTLGISQKPIYTAHETKNVNTNSPTPDMRGKSKRSLRKPEGDPDFARAHIKSFPVVESHYCRANTKRSYLEPKLNLSIMHDLYKQQCIEKGFNPVKISMYRHIFYTEFNLGFHIPKKDRCDLCEKVKVAKEQDIAIEDGLMADYERHTVLKNSMRDARANEKENKEMPVLLFDLENVILTPHAEISSFFYLRKLNVYNLTAYYSVTKQVYCAVWNETMAGRAGNDIASAFHKILRIVCDENDVTSLITWSDSCVPQNRNSIISNAVLHFLKETPSLQSLTMKYSLPGHSCVQEVDNVHSQIEKLIKKTEFYSPIGLIRILKQVNRKNPFRVIQMTPEDFKDFSSTAKLYNYNLVPYTKISVIQFTQILHIVNFKTSHDIYEPMQSVNTRFNVTAKRKRSKKSSGSDSSNLIQPKVQKCMNEISHLKKKDIQTALPFIPQQDREFYRVVLKL